MEEAWMIHRETQQRHDLAGVTMIGRMVDCGISIVDPSVSRRHAMIRKQDDGFWYFDLGSFNGQQEVKRSCSRSGKRGGAITSNFWRQGNGLG